MPSNSPDKLARRRRRRFLARRRCQRALGRTMTFIILVTPFLYFGYVLCCHMPPSLRSAVPSWIFLYECWLFLRNTYIFFRYIWPAPAWAPWPIVVTILFLLFYPPGPYNEINQRVFFDRFRQDMMEVVQMVERRELDGSNASWGLACLPERYKHVSFVEREVAYERTEHGLRVYFSTAWGRFDAYQGFAYYSDDTPENWDPDKRVFIITKQERYWYHVFY
jgi:hypothetical protein